MLKKIEKIYSKYARSNRGKIFRKYLNPTTDDKILDLGGGDGAHLAEIIPFRGNIYLADIDSNLLEKGRTKFGFNPILLNENGRLPFPDFYFDVVFCSSVIEHVTVVKKKVYFFTSNFNFSTVALRRQKLFADEIKRVGKKYYVQTPYKYFPIESHTWFPSIIILLPRLAQIRVINLLNKFWPKQTSPDWHLLTINQMKKLFPDSQIILEKSFGFTKSIIAIHR